MIDYLAFISNVVGGAILVGIIGITMYIIGGTEVQKKLDAYRRQFGFNEDIERKFIKSDKQLDRVKSAFLKRANK